MEQQRIGKVTEVTWHSLAQCLSVYAFYGSIVNEKDMTSSKLLSMIWHLPKKKKIFFSGVGTTKNILIFLTFGKKRMVGILQ